MAEQHRSIGEVLTLLREEFPDVTISKIRFLESQGLVDPERTPSGYRRFYDRDIERLRWILRQQREHYLPLKVIKDRLTGVAGDADPDPVPSVSAAPAAQGVDPDPAPPAESRSGDDVGAHPRVLPEPSIFAARGRAVEPPAPARAQPRTEDLTAISLTAQELADHTGMAVTDLHELERFGLVSHRMVGNTAIYDGDALVVARLVAGFRAHGIEARHLRMFKVAADREAALFEQVVLPLARQRALDARRRMAETLTDLSRLTDSLHSVLLRSALREIG